MLHGCLARYDLNQLHHTAVFVGQNVAMENVDAGEIVEALANLDVPSDHCAVDRNGRRNPNGVLPDVGRLQPKGK